jgi:hypothetical protein
LRLKYKSEPEESGLRRRCFAGKAAERVAYDFLNTIIQRKKEREAFGRGSESEAVPNSVEGARDGRRGESLFGSGERF